MKKKYKVSIGSWITMGHISVAEIMCDAGFDWLCIDMEHSVIDFYEAQILIAVINAKGIKSFVRVGDNNPLLIKRVLDAGADGIIVPLVKNRAEAEAAVRAVKYPPMGTRGVGLARAQGYGFDFENYKNTKVKEITLIAQIEHVDAINNLEDILSTEGVDGTFIGPYDLSGSIGKPGEFTDPLVKELLSRYELIVKKYDKLIGYHVIQPNHELVREKIEKGYNFIAVSLDTIFLGDTCRTLLKNLEKER